MFHLGCIIKIEIKYLMLYYNTKCFNTYVFLILIIHNYNYAEIEILANVCEILSVFIQNANFSIILL